MFDDSGGHRRGAGVVVRCVRVGARSRRSTPAQREREKGLGFCRNRGGATMRAVSLTVCIGVLTCMLGIGLVGCGLNSPPVKSLEQWNREINAVRSRD